MKNIVANTIGKIIQDLESGFCFLKLMRHSLDQDIEMTLISLGMELMLRQELSFQLENTFTFNRNLKEALLTCLISESLAINQKALNKTSFLVSLTGYWESTFNTRRY